MAELIACPWAACPGAMALVRAFASDVATTGAVGGSGHREGLGESVLVVTVRSEVTVLKSPVVKLFATTSCVASAGAAGTPAEVLGAADLVAPGGVGGSSVITAAATAQARRGLIELAHVAPGFGALSPETSVLAWPTLSRCRC